MKKLCVFVEFFHRGPTSSPPSANNYDSFSDLKFNGQSHRPAGFLSGINGYFNPYLQKHGFYGAINPKDRVSIGGGKLAIPIDKTLMLHVLLYIVVCFARNINKQREKNTQ